MSAVTSSIGINSLTGGIIERVTTSRKTTTKIIRNHDSTFAQAATFDPMSEFEISGRGDAPAITLGTATADIPSSISGGVILITESSESHSNEDFPQWSYKGVHYPGAS